jgi:hypothetical protein
LNHQESNPSRQDQRNYCDERDDFNAQNNFTETLRNRIMLKKLHNRTHTAFDFKSFITQQHKEKNLKRKEQKDRLSFLLNETKQI